MENDISGRRASAPASSGGISRTGGSGGQTDANLNALPAGHEVEGYRIERVLGVGGFGITYLAEEIALARHVAIKEYLPSGIGQREELSLAVRPVSEESQNDYEWGLERFRQEGATLVTFSHPNIVSVYRFFEAHDTAYLVMAYERGRPIDQIVDEIGPMSEAEICGVLTPVAEGLLDIHNAGYLHRDVTPGNILVREDGTPVLIDFGAARRNLEKRSAKMTAIVTDGYAPAEQYSDETKQGPWTDIYGLGATTYFMMTGTRPATATDRLLHRAQYQTDSLKPIEDLAEHEYSDILTGVVEQALALNASDRPASIDAWLAPLWEIGVRPPGAEKEPVAGGITRLAGPPRGDDGLPVESRPASWGEFRWPREAFLTRAKRTRHADSVLAGEQKVENARDTESLYRNGLVALGIVVAFVGAYLLIDWMYRSGPASPAASPGQAAERALPDPAKMKLGALIAEIDSTKAALRRSPGADWRRLYDRRVALETEMARRIYARDKAILDPEVAAAAEAFKARQFDVAYKKALAAAEGGHPEAMHMLGRMFDSGKGVDRNLQRAVYWYRRAAELGHAAAQHNLALMLHAGLGGPKDPARAVEWARKSAAQGHTEAELWTARALEEGRGVKKDLVRARLLYQAAARKENAEALYRLGVFYHQGLGIAPDWSRALGYYRRAAALGHAEAAAAVKKADAARAPGAPGASDTPGNRGSGDPNATPGQGGEKKPEVIRPRTSP